MGRDERPIARAINTTIAVMTASGTATSRSAPSGVTMLCKAREQLDPMTRVRGVVAGAAERFQECTEPCHRQEHEDQPSERRRSTAGVWMPKERQGSEQAQADEAGEEMEDRVSPSLAFRDDECDHERHQPKARQPVGNDTDEPLAAFGVVGRRPISLTPLRDECREERDRSEHGGDHGQRRFGRGTDDEVPARHDHADRADDDERP